MGSFKVRLALYFALVALLPFAAAFQGFHALSKRSETSRVDSVLQTGLRSALAAYSFELDEAERDAAVLARRRSFQRALAERDRAELARIVRRHPNLSIRARGRLRVGRTNPPVATRTITVFVGRRPAGELVVAVPIDRKLVRRLKSRIGLESTQRLAFVDSDRVLAGDGLGGSRLDLTTGEAHTVSIREERYRAVASPGLPQLQGARLALFAPQGEIDRTTGLTARRLELTMLAALVLLILIAYFEGRAIVRTLGRFGAAAHDIAQGRLDRRVPVRGRDEFAKLGRAFNEMADQLEARMEELDSERRRLRDATMRFGEALAATHDIDGLLQTLVETAVDATGATGGLLVSEEGEIIRKGDPASGADRFSEPLTLILTDLDDFKAVNDVHGHPTGDEVLREFARTLKSCIREIDLAARWGGEEFAVLLPGTDIDGAIHLAERIRAALTDRVVVAPTGERLRCTASFGVAEWEGSTEAAQLLAGADAALYHAKGRGKNRVEAAGNVSVEASGVSA